MDKKGLKSMIKNNRYTVITICIFILLLIVLFATYKLFFPNTGVPVYGDRLDGIEEVKLSKDDLKDVDSKIEETDFVVSSKSSLSGKIINTIIIVKSDTSKDTAKTITDTVLKSFEKDYVDYYDFQVFIKNEDNEKEGYPIIGYKNNDNESFSYSSAK